MSKKDFDKTFNELDADFFCIQETKMQAGQLKLELPGYHQYFDYAERKGYSGTAIFTKHEPLNVSYGIQADEFDHEGRAITLEYPDFYLVNSYVPNSGAGLKRLDFRMGWDTAFQSYLAHLNQDKPVILCGDLNVAHKEIDLKNPQSNHHNAGFTDEERQSFSHFLDQASLIRFAIFTQTWPIFILGGATGSTPVIGMPVGGSITLLQASGLPIKLRTQKS